jgi:hypothetical protein
MQSEVVISEDIDGIRIRYDSEGGVSKRSYNYRVSIVLPCSPKLIYYRS